MAYEKAAATFGANPTSDNSVTLDADMLPPGMTAKVGDTLQFTVTEGPDADGAITGTFTVAGDETETMEEGEAVAEATPEGGEKTGSWEEDFRKSMSPQAPPTEEA